MRSIRSVFFLLILSTLLLPQRSAAGTLTEINDDLVRWTELKVAAMPGEDSGGFDEPDAAEIADFEDAVGAMLAENWSLADDLAADVDYEVVLFRDQGHGGEVLYGLLPLSTNTDGRGYFFIRPGGAVERRLVIEAPHPVNDNRTGVFASEIFRSTGARTFFLAGTDRCSNANEPSDCSGQTEACGGSIDHPISDMAHAVDAFFHAFHRVAGNEHGDTRVIQIHGFKADVVGEPEFSASDGTDVDNANPLYLPNDFADDLGQRMALAAGTPARPANSCNRAGDQNFKCGTQSVQGRATNGSANACTIGVSTANGRFMHLEMSNDLRDPGGVYSERLVIDSINAVFPTQAQIGDRVWADLNGNGLQETGEPGIDGVTVELQDGAGALLASQATAAGAYLFHNLDAGDYRVKVIPPAGYSIAPRDVLDAFYDNSDSDIDQTDGRTLTFPLSPGQRLSTIDAGLVPPGVGRIGDRAWVDTNGNGKQDPGEPGLGGVTVRLLNAAGVEVAVTTSAGPGPSHGAYVFQNVLPGSYKLRFESPGWGITQRVAGFPDIDSDIESNGETAVFTVSPGSTNLSLDAGFISTCVEVALVPKNAIWKWHQPTSAPANWNQPSFSDTTWASDFTPLGYGTSDAAGVIPVPNTAASLYTTYTRLAFQVDEPGLFQQNLRLEVQRDDGVIVYVNGTEVLRSNVKTGTVTANTPALGHNSSTVTINIPKTLLVTGTNLLAVEIHEAQNASGTRDGLFQLGLFATACNPCRVRQVDVTNPVSTYLAEDDPDDNYGGSTSLDIRGTTGDAEEALFAWQLTGIPATAKVLQADLAFFVTDESSALYPLFALKRSWSEGDATWFEALDQVDWQVAGAAGVDDRGTLKLGLMPRKSGTNVTATVPLNGDGRNLVQQWIAGTAPNHGLIAVTGVANQTNSLKVHSNEGANPPVLRVTYVLPVCTQ